MIKTALLKKTLTELGKIAKCATGRPHLACVVVTVQDAAGAGTTLSLHATDGHRVSVYEFRFLAEGLAPMRTAIPVSKLALVKAQIAQAGKEIPTKDLLAIFAHSEEEDEGIVPPPLDKVIPPARGGTGAGVDTFTVNPKYLADAARAAAVVGTSLRVQQDKALCPIRFDCESEDRALGFAGVVMPLRD